VALPILIGPRCNIQVTCDSDPNNDRSESELVVNPLDPYNLLGASKEFTDPAHYNFSLAPYASFDGGKSWIQPSLTLPTIAGKVVAGTSDPTVCFDDQGIAYLLGLIFSSAPIELLGMAMYISSDGGRTWGPPNVIDQGVDDKQTMGADLSPASPYKGHVYAAWDTNGVVFARSIDHGASWTGAGGLPVGSSVIPAGRYPSISVDSSGQVWIFAIGTDPASGQPAILYATSPDGGNSFSAVQVAALGIHIVGGLPGNPFRVETIPSSCAVGQQVVVAWADSRDPDVHVYYRSTNSSGKSWRGSTSGDLLTAAAPSPAGQADIMPQLALTPNGEVGCCFYEYGPKTVGGPPLIHVELVASTDGAKTFPNRVDVTDQPWDPTVDPVTDEYGNHFIGDYFGFAASSLGFFPFFTSTITLVQEIFTSRLAVMPADVYIRDSSSDTGAVPSPGNHWEAPDLIVSRSSTPPASWISDPLVHDGVTPFYVYGKANNLGPNPARNVKLAVTVGNFPSLLGMPGSEFRYPQDWYQGDWSTAAIANNHLWLGESAPVNIPSGGGPVILGPVTWPAAQIPAEGSWHPCLLAELRSDNDDSAGGAEGCPVQASTGPCNPGSFFWGVNDACQRNLTYLAPYTLQRVLQFPVIVGSPWSNAEFVEVIVDKGDVLADVPMSLHIRSLGRNGSPDETEGRRGILFKEAAHVAVLSGSIETGELWAAPGSIWRPPLGDGDTSPRGVNAVPEAGGWRLMQRRSVVGLRVTPGQLHVATLRFTVRPEHHEKEGSTVRIWQRNDRRIVTGGVTLVLGASVKRADRDSGGRHRAVRRSRPRRSRS
jgi:hypothetical protein